MSKGYSVRLEPYESYGEYRQMLKVEHNGKTIIDQSDGGEPEDQSFYRDWAWVPKALEQAYALGREDAEKRTAYLEAGIVSIIEAHENIANQEEERAELDREPDSLREKLRGRAVGRRYVTEKLRALKDGHLIVAVLLPSEVPKP